MSAIKKNIVYNTLLSLSQVLFPLITFPYASRILGPGGIGQVSFIDSLTQYFILFASVGIPLYGVREIAKVKSDVVKMSKLFSELIFLHLITTAVFVVAYIILFFVLKDKEVNVKLFYIGILTLLGNVFIIEWFYQAQEKFDFITKRTLLLRLVFVCLLFALVKSSNDVVIYYSLFFGLQLLNAIVNFTLSFKFHVRLMVSGLNLKQHIRPLLFLTACSVIGSVYVLLDNVILGMISNKESVGFYSSAIKITKVPISMINALGLVLVPQMSEAFHQKDYEKVKYFVANSFHYVLALGVPLCMGIALTAPWTVRLISGNSFLPSIALVYTMAPIVIFIALNCVFFFQIFTPDNKEKSMLVILVISAFISITMNLLLIPPFHHLGAAITTTATEFSVLLMSMFFAHKFYGITIQMSNFFKPLLASLLFIPIVYTVGHLHIAYGLQFIIAAAACGIAYYVIQRFVFKDVIIIKMEHFALNPFIKKFKRSVQ
ncbi:Membrane protein involved in the export of O-antigen and teichoic acid [Filimonas lacunae]|uniref:Membrane protein involved in the export of O-antigen and teichoic acid n=1 Tax=Filimonas lacunae TaxID=477680 RepID=A0A173MS64_9BACT|nr:flippase [Filimonas lacunae]BAV10198.1 membrane protein [Filimonas lacunae]SIT18354.1 Membrane protein involved in the export of O-antigen and teichoic acid [Filimonas lacunae]